jgi:hypothetical protein
MRYPKNLITPLIVLAVLGALAVGILSTLSARSLVVDTASAQPSVPNPGHSYQEVGLPEGTWPNLDADRLDGLDASDLTDGCCLAKTGALINRTGYHANCTGGYEATLYTVPADKRALIRTINSTENSTAGSLRVYVTAASGVWLAPIVNGLGVSRTVDVVIGPGDTVGWDCNQGGTAQVSMTGFEFEPAP